MIAGMFIVAIVATFSKWGGAISAGIMSAFSTYFVFKARQKKLYLEDEYHIGKYGKRENPRSRG